MKIIKPWLGVKSMDVNRQIASYYSLSVDGALVVEVSPRSPAERTGLRPGDVITMMDGKPIRAPPTNKGVEEEIGRPEG